MTTHEDSRNKAFYGHAGRPGKVGGSIPATSAMSRTTGAAAVAKMRGQAGSKIAAANSGTEPLKPGGYKAGKPAYKVPDNVASDYTYYVEEIEGFKNFKKDTIYEDVKNSVLGLYTGAGERNNLGVTDNVLTELSERTGIHYNTCKQMLFSWVQTSNDNSIQALNMQSDFAEELGVELSDWQKGKLKYAEGEWQIHHYSADSARFSPKEDQKRFAREMYNLTQERLAEIFPGKDTITLHRGVNLSGQYTPGDFIKYKGNAIESWSLSKEIGYGFAYDNISGVVFSMEVPIKNIVGSYFSGFGSFTEDEFVIAGSVPGNQAIISWVRGKEEE